MECTLIGLFVAAIVVAMIVSHSRTSSSTATAPRAESGVQITEERVPESGMRLWLVKATGSYQASQQSVQAALGFVVLDVTGGQSDPVICRVPELFENGLALSSREIRLPHQEGQFNDLVAGIVPIDSIVCPYRGHRRLRFMAFLRESKSQRVLWSEDCYRQYEQKGYGFIQPDNGGKAGQIDGRTLHQNFRSAGAIFFSEIPPSASVVRGAVCTGR